MPRIRGFRWWIAVLLFGASALSFFDRQVLSVLAPQILRDLSISNREYSYAVSAFTLAYSVMFTIGGRLIDRMGTRVGLGFCVAYWTFSSLLHAITQNAMQLTLFRMMLGIGEGACFPGGAKGVMEWFPARERALAMGIATTGGSAFGAVLAPPLIVLASQWMGWRGAFVGTGLIGVVWVLLWFLFFRQPEQSRLVSEAERALVLGQRSVRPAAGAGKAKAWPWHEVLNRKEVWGLLATRFLLDPVFYFYMFWIPQYLHQERGASLEDIGRVAWIPFLTLGISSMIGGALSDALVRRGLSINAARKGVMAGAALLTPLSIFALVTPDLSGAMLLLGVLMFAHGFWMTNYMTMIGDLFPASTVATVVGLSGTAGGIGGFLSSLLVGAFIELVGYAPMFVVCGVLYPLGFGLIAWAVPRVHQLSLHRDPGTA
jgi:ACS family hexuronate transporter-like MFS transporter